MVSKKRKRGESPGGFVTIELFIVLRLSHNAEVVSFTYTTFPSSPSLVTKVFFCYIFLPKLFCYHCAVFFVHRIDDLQIIKNKKNIEYLCCSR